MKNVNIKTKIAAVISILCMIAAVANIFVMNEIIRVIIWSGVIIVFALDSCVMLENNMKIAKEMFFERQKALSYERLLLHVIDMLREDVSAEQIIDKIDKELEEKEIKNAN